MINETILDFIRQSRQAGTSDDQIRQSLLSSGWQTQDIQEVFNSLDSSPMESTVNLSSSRSKSPKFIFIFAIIGVLVVGYLVSAQFGLLPNLGKIKEIVLGINPLNNVSVKDKEIPSTETSKIGVNSGTDKFYYAVIEKISEQPKNRGLADYYAVLTNIVTIYQYDVATEKLSKVFGPYPSGANYLEANYAPRSAISENGKALVFTDSALFTFPDGKDGIKVFTPNIALPKDLLTENVESPVFSPDGNSIAYSFGNQIKMVNKTTGEYKVLIKDASKLASNTTNYEGSFAYPVFWYKKDNDDRLLVEIRSANQNGLPIALTGFYEYSFLKNISTPINFYYAPGKKIGPCTGADWSCEQSPIVNGRSPDGHYELILVGNYGNTTSAIIDYSALTTSLSVDLKDATKSLSSCSGIWSNDSKKFLCVKTESASGANFLNSSDATEFSKQVIDIINNDKPIDLINKYTIVDVKSGAVLSSSEEKFQVVIPQKIRDDGLNAIKQFDEVVSKNGMLKGSKEYNVYLQQLAWEVYLKISPLFTEQGKTIVGWAGNGTFLAIKTKCNEYGCSYGTLSQEVVLTDLKGNTKTLGVYSVDPGKTIKEKDLIGNLRSASIIDGETLSSLEKKILAGNEFTIIIDEIHIKYLGSVLPQ